jgi:ribosomal protein S18 acetylase RimI-like enzyme
MNRMFVKKEARGRGAGQLLCQGILRRGAEMGFAEMTLDTLTFMTSAIRLYRSMGFVDDTRPGLYDADNPMTVQLCRSLSDLVPES